MKKLNTTFILLFILVSFPFVELFAQEFTLSEKIAARWAGPFHFRFVFQPIVAAFLGFRDGITDAALGNPPYVLEIFSNKGDRRKNLMHGLHSIWKPLLLGLIIDSVVQIFLFHSLNVKGALLVGFLFVGLPYILARGLRNRFAPA